MNETLQDPDERADTPDTDLTTDRTRHTTCPECGGAIRRDEEHGERTCEDCGLILSADELDHGAEWRAFFDGERQERSRVGGPVTELMHDRGLSTVIGWQDRDASGRAVSSRKRAQLQRLRTWDERFRTRTPQERNLKHGFGEIERMASALGLSHPCRETAAVLYRRAVDEELLPGRSIEAMSAASLYAAARRHDTPRTIDTVASVSRVDGLPVQRAYRYLSGELGLKIAPTDPALYLRQLASQLDVSEEAERVARELLETATAQGVHSGKSPDGLAAAAIYAATHLTNERLTQATVGDVANVSAVTIRNRYRELLEVYGEQGGR